MKKKNKNNLSMNIERREEKRREVNSFSSV